MARFKEISWLNKVPLMVLGNIAVWVKMTSVLRLVELVVMVTAR